MTTRNEFVMSIYDRAYAYAERTGRFPDWWDKFLAELNNDGKNKNTNRSSGR